MAERIVRTYEYKGIELGQLVEYGSGEFRTREFRPNLSEYEAIDLLREMDSEDKVHMKHRAYAVHRLLEEHGLKPDDYIDNEDVMVHIANCGYKNLTELNRGDPRAWKLVKQRGLEDELFLDIDSVKE